jgi:hypothetical protein
MRIATETIIDVKSCADCLFYRVDIGVSEKEVERCTESRLFGPNIFDYCPFRGQSNELVVVYRFPKRGEDAP